MSMLPKIFKMVTVMKMEKQTQYGKKIGKKAAKKRINQQVSTDNHKTRGKNTE